MNRDRNLLFGILAVQMGKVTPSQLVEAAGAWAADPSQNLASRLMSSGVLKEKDRALLDAFVEEAVKAHEGDSGKTLAAFGGQQQVNATFHGSIILSESGGVDPAPSAQSDRYVDATSVPSVEESPDRYTHVSEYGRGGMGRVLLVHDAYLGRNIALKELLPGAEGSSGPATPATHYMNILSRFLQEARITGQLEHPSIVPVYELGHRSDGTLYYTMKLVRGRTLRQALAEADGLQGRLQLLPHFVDLCNAIAYAHSQGVIHRDIKPANVMVGEFGETVVLDWGLAKSRDQADVHADEMAETLRMWEMAEQPAVIGLTAHGQIMGTPAYMAPEQAKGQIDQLDVRTDVYALGVVLYELLTGQTPFQGKSAKEILDKVIGAQPRPVAKLASNAPAELAAIAMRAMDKNAANRYQSAKDLADEVQRFQSGALVKAYEYTFGDRATRLIRRHKALITTAAVALVVLMVATGFYVVSLTQANRLLVEARNTAEDKTRTEGEARKVAEETVEKLKRASYASSIQLAQKHLDAQQRDLARSRLMETPEHLRNWEWGYLYRTMDNSKLTLTGHKNGLLSASFSPDGSRIVTASNDNTAKVWDSITGAEVLTLTGHRFGVNSASFSPDGSRIVTASDDSTAKVWDATTGAEVLTLTGHGKAVYGVSFRPDGARVVTASSDLTAKVWDVTTGAEVLTLTGHREMVYSVSFSPDGVRIVTASYDNTAKV
ncbi:MAG: hypothetical protein AMXMBFR84_10810 [Candidatus Hydrogenedentota bacterium]